MKRELYVTNKLPPLDEISGFPVRPGFFDVNGATAFLHGVSFTVHSHNATDCSLVLFHHRESEPFAILKFPRHYRIGHTFSMFVYGLDVEDIEYAYCFDGPYDPSKGLLFDKTKYILDPYARAVTGQSMWGQKFDNSDFYKARVVKNNFDWGDTKQPHIPMEDLIIYEMHVRNFTRHSSSGVSAPGTFDGIKEKIPYLRSLGVNCVELMPVFEFNEMLNRREIDGKELLECWGYNTVSFFAPNTCFSSEREQNYEGRELKELIKTLNENGIEVILDVVFNHTGEGNEFGPFFSFKGVDNNIYYMLAPDGHYYNFSGCGNTLNCNHPIVQQMILECLRYWVINYRVDGFRFDLASILGRNEDGSPMSKPPLLQSLAFDPILGDVKLIAEAWDAGGLYQVGSFPSWNRWAEWNGKYRDDMRRFLKGDDGMAQAAALRLTGSADLYPEESRGRNASVNFLTCHDGFTLYDLYAYNRKHNEANGWENTDGDNNGNSWNCGEEGPTQDQEVLSLRRRMIKNACVSLFCSMGTPMFYAGDEFGNTQFGNNNPYCQDNEISWLDWGLIEKNRELFEFFRFMICFRKSHAVLRKRLESCSLGFPQISTHGSKPFISEFSWESKQVAVMFAGRSHAKDDIVYAAFNTYWESRELVLPDLHGCGKWQVVVDTAQENPIQKKILVSGRLMLGARSAAVLVYIAI
ncbi:MAG: alpha-amylase family glycosyl hydrolase [Lachnospiraceae bacterium]